MPPHIRCDGILETGKFLPVESGILGCGIRYSTQGIRNPASLTIYCFGLLLLLLFYIFTYC